MALRALAHLLAPRHGHGVVVENFVSDIDTGRDALPNGQHATVKVSAIAHVGKHVLIVAEGLLPYPRYTFSAHLREAHCAAVHPHTHKVATYARHRARTFGDARGGVVRTTGAKPRCAFTDGVDV